MPAESARSAEEIRLENCLHSSTMLTGGELVVPFRVTLLGRASFWPRRGDKFGIWSRNGSSSVTSIAERCSPLYAIERVFIACVCRGI